MNYSNMDPKYNEAQYAKGCDGLNSYNFNVTTN